MGVPPDCVVDNEPDFDLVKTEIEFQPHKFVHFGTNTLG